MSGNDDYGKIIITINPLLFYLLFTNVIKQYMNKKSSTNSHLINGGEQLKIIELRLFYSLDVSSSYDLFRNFKSQY
jgi:hypothetical protein